MALPKAPQALFLVGFGGPEGPEDVWPFLESVTAGRNIPADRLTEVADRYLSRGGISPVNERMRSILDSVQKVLEREQLDIPVFWGNRNSTPFIEEAIEEIDRQGLTEVAAWITSPYRSYSSCRQYLEQIEAGMERVDGRVSVTRLRPHFDHPGCIETAADRLTEALLSLPKEKQEETRLLFSAHSLPMSDVETCSYVEEINEAARLISERVDPKNKLSWEVVWQSRSGPPQVPWLVPDVCDRIGELAAEGISSIAISPVGFIVHNFEIEWDLDVEAAECADGHGMAFVRAETADSDPRFAEMIVDLLKENFSQHPVPLSLGNLGITPVPCPSDCCPSPSRSLG
ncbi:MAG TPA: ferrochelatase [Acidimicrobiales bacterium]|nr:ferrochelatase [Acidimicrobiales bacterium]|tara:strand:+ start:212 stop:1243 length:1032 start_codon:yes stop_codon:yes gene_type:complete